MKESLLYEYLIKKIAKNVYRYVDDYIDLKENDMILERYGYAFLTESSLNEGLVPDKIKNYLVPFKNILAQAFKGLQKIGKSKQAKVFGKTFLKGTMAIIEKMKYDENKEVSDKTVKTQIFVLFLAMLSIAGGTAMLNTLDPSIARQQVELEHEMLDHYFEYADEDEGYDADDSGAKLVIYRNGKKLMRQALEKEGLETAEGSSEKIASTGKSSSTLLKKSYKKIDTYTAKKRYLIGNMRITNECKKHIKNYEKLRLYPYFASAGEKQDGKVTIGYGHVITKDDGELYELVQQMKAKGLIKFDSESQNTPEIITAAVAEKMFDFDCEEAIYRFLETLDRKDKKGRQLNPNVKKAILKDLKLVDGFVSICYNAGKLDMNSNAMLTLMRCRFDKKTGTINKNDYKVFCERVKYEKTRVKGKLVQGLVNRRIMEVRLFFYLSKILA